MHSSTIDISRSAKRTVGASLPKRATAIGGATRAGASRSRLSMGASKLVEKKKNMKPSALVSLLQGGSTPLDSITARTEIIELLNMGDYTSQTECAVEVDKPIFQPFPPVLEFTNYRPFEPCMQKLVFRNNDKFARRMKVLPPDSPFFKVEGPFNTKGTVMVDGRVAPGTEMVFNITFTPRDIDDYQFELVCATEREKFVVPLRAHGKRAVLFMPDSISFPAVAVKSSSTKNFVIRNGGTRGTEFRLSSTQNFSVSPTRAFVETGDCVPVTVTFHPTEVEECAEEIIVTYAEGYSCAIDVNGAATLLDVQLSTAHVALEATYVSLQTTKTIVLKNDSDTPIQFAWKKFADKDEEEEEKQRLLAKLHAEYAHEHIESPSGGLEFKESKAKEDDDLLLTDMVHGPTAVAELRKLRAAELAIERQDFLFDSDVFSVTPQTGTLWSKSAVEFTVTFTPNDSRDFSELAFLDVTGQAARMQLDLGGTGIGPRLAFAYDVIDVGEVTVTSVHRYELLLMNRGEIGATWEMNAASTPFGAKFLFDPDHGQLDVGHSAPISVYFTSDVLGAFSETFEARMQGCSAILRVHFKGVVVPPAFSVSTRVLDFEHVPFDFPQTRIINVRNDSDVPFPFSLRIPADAAKSEREFRISPSSGAIEPGAEQEVAVEFTSRTAKEYIGYTLTLDVERVGDELLRLPIKATCVVPTIQLEQESLNYGTCFVRHPYPLTLTLKNSDDHPARFTVVPQDEHTQVIAKYDCSVMEGVVPAQGTADIEVQLTSFKVGPIILPLFINIAGRQEGNLKAELVAEGRGPLVVCSPSPLTWGSINCLTNVTKVLNIDNQSLIPASVELRLRNPKSRFALGHHELLLRPGEIAPVDITACLDDICNFQDELEVSIVEAEPISVTLAAKGIGHTVVADQSFQDVEFGSIPTTGSAVRRYTLSNNGRKNQVVTWVNTTVKAKEAALRKADRTRTDVSVQPVFTVKPASMVLRPGYSATFEVEAKSDTPCEGDETIEVQVKADGDRSFVQMASFACKASFVHPLLSFEPANVNFCVAPASMDPLQTQTFTATNISAVPVAAKLVFQPLAWQSTTVTPADAIYLNTSRVSLNPGESATFDVSFNSMYRNDYQGHVIKGKILVVYEEHTRRDQIPVIAEVKFANLTFDNRQVKFGCILNDTIVSKVIQCTNASDLVANICWSLVEDEEAACNTALAAGQEYIPINKVFDIKPIRYTLAPGETLPVEISYYGHTGRAFDATAICTVTDGPEYELSMSGEASIAAFKLDRQVVDFGKVLYDSVETKEVVLLNVGKVEYDFSITPKSTDTFANALDSDATPIPITHLLGNRVDVSPASGRIAPGERVKFTIKLLAAFPDALRESLMLRVGHFEPLEVAVLATGVMSPIHVGAAREGGEGDWNRALEVAMQTHHVDDTHAVMNSFGNAWEDSVATARRAASPRKQIAAPLSDAAINAVYEANRLVYRNWIAKALIDASSANNNTAPVPLPRLVSACEAQVMHHYVIDFGNVVQGTLRKRNVSFTNTGRWDTVVALDRNAIHNTPFKIDPLKLSKLPERATLEISIGIDTRFGGIHKGRDVPLGPYECPVFVQVDRGPSCLLILRGVVTVPDLRITPDTLDFGELFFGQEKMLHMQFHNVTPVPLQWNVIQPMVITKVDDRAAFRVEPDMGSLAPGERALIKVVFAPTETKPYSVPIAIKIHQNPKNRTLLFKGLCSHPSLRFDNVQLVPRGNLLVLGPQMPFDRPSERVVRIVNESKLPVEVFALDFDAQYAEEHRLLQQHEELFDENGQLRITARLPGQKLTDVLSIANPAETAADAPSAADVTPASLSLLELPADNSPRAQGRALNVVVQGPAFSGVSNVAQLLGAHLGAAVLKLTDVVLWAREGGAGAALADNLREWIRVWPPEMTGAESDTRLSPKPTSAAAKRDPKDAKGKTKSVDVSSNVNRVPVAFVAEALAARISRRDCSQAVVLDGLDCEFLADTTESAVAVAAAFRQRVPYTTVFTLDVPADALATKYNQLSLDLTAQLSDLDSQLMAIDSTLSKGGKPASKGGKSGKPDTAEAPAIDTAEVEKKRDALMAERKSAALLLTKAKKALEGVADLESMRSQRMVQAAIVLDDVVVPVPPLPFTAAAPLTPPSTKASSKPEKKEERDDDEGKVFPTLEGVPTGINVHESPAHHIVAAQESITLAEIEALIPALPENSTPFNMDFTLPAASSYEILRRPQHELERNAELAARFRISVPIKQTEAELSTSEAAPSPPSSAAGKSKVAAPVQSPTKSSRPGTANSHHKDSERSKHSGEFDGSRGTVRFVLQPGESHDVLVQFAAKDVGTFSADARFAVVGSPRLFTCMLNGQCAVPTIIADPRSVYTQRAKSRADDHRKHAQGRGPFDFGPLLSGRPKQDRAENHSSKWRIYNNGVFSATIALSIAGADTITPWVRNSGAQTPRADAAEKEKEKEKAPERAPSVKGKADAKDAPPDTCFTVEPATIESLGPGESAEITVWAFPGDAPLPNNAIGLLHTNTIVAAIKDNPERMTFPVSCIATTPQIELKGPWDFQNLSSTDPKKEEKVSTARKESASKGAKPKGSGAPESSVDTGAPCIDFDRQLAGRTEIRTFTVTNVSLIPVAWRLDLSSVLNPAAAPTTTGKGAVAQPPPTETKGPSAFRISPIEGRLQPNESCDVDVSFGAEVEMTRAHTIAVEYTDAELGFTEVDTVSTARPGSAADVRGRGGATAKKTDVAPPKPRIQRTPLSLKGEIYRVISSVRFEDTAAVDPKAQKASSASKGTRTETASLPPMPSTGMLDFGNLRVGESAQRFIPMTNGGKYPISFKLQFLKAGVEEFMTMAPMEGVLQPGQETRVAVTFQAGREVRLAGAKCVQLSIIDAGTSIATDVIPLLVTAATSFSRFVFSPNKVLNFGPTRYGVDKEKKLEIRNTGIFPMEYRIAVLNSAEDTALLELTSGKTAGSLLAVNAGSPSPPPSATGKTKDAKASAAKAADKKGVQTSMSAIEAAARASDGPLSDFGRFYIEVPMGTVLPGASAFVPIRFFPCGNQLHRCAVRVHVSNFDHLAHNVDTLSYELLGESCVPGIVTNDFSSIFEEHTVVPTLTQLGTGPHIGAMPTAEADQQSASLYYRTRTGFGLRENAFYFGNVVYSMFPKGVTERICISNPTKITSTVTVAIKAEDAAMAAAFSVTPAVLELPAHESRYVDITFLPTSVRQYQATFCAEVEGGSLEHSRKCEFFLRGDGALPSVALVRSDAASKSLDARAGINFGKARVGSRRTEAVAIKNTGLFPAVVTLDLTPSRTFGILLSDSGDMRSGTLKEDGSRSITMSLQPGCTGNATVSFHAAEDSYFNAEDMPGMQGIGEDGVVSYGADLLVRVAHNAFSQEQVHVAGGVYMPDIVLEGMDEAKPEDSITFPPLPLSPENTLSTKSLSLTNPSDRAVRFEWNVTAPGLTITPRCGHIPVGGRTNLTAQFKPDINTPTTWTLDTSATLTYARIGYDPLAAFKAGEERAKGAGGDVLTARSGGKSTSRPGSVPKAGATKPGAAAGKDKDAKAAAGKAPAGTAKAPVRRRSNTRRTVDPAEPVVAWSSDDASTVFVSAESAEGKAALESGKGMLVAGGRDVRVQQPVPEPAYAVIMDDDATDSTPVFASTAADELSAYQSLPVHVQAVADVLQLAFEDAPSATTKTLNFAPTMMMQSRSITFVVVNSSKVDADVAWMSKAGGAFKITPPTTNLAAGSKTTFVIAFTPKEADDFDETFTLDCPQLQHGKELRVHATGRAQRPVCHLDIPHSEYLSRRAPGLPGPTGAVAPLDASIRVVEIGSLGIGHRTTKKFFLVNPTAASYEFSLDVLRPEISVPIRCTTPKGMVLAGKRFEVAFEFVASDTAPVESFWRFAIPSAGIMQLFLVVGTVAEPTVSIDRPSVAFRPLLLGATASETVHITNEEDIPLSFQLHWPGGKGEEAKALTVSPARAVIPAKGRCAVKLSFSPTLERMHNVNLAFAVDRKSYDLVLNVKGDGYALHDSVTIEDESASKSRIDLSSTGVNYLDFGEVQVHEKIAKHIVLENHGTFAYDFQWSPLMQLKHGRREAVASVSIKPMSGKVPKGSQTICSIEYHPTQPERLSELPASLLIAGTKAYQISLSSLARQASIQFSTLELDFGDCFCAPAGTIEPMRYTRILKIQNTEADRDISVSCTFLKKAHLVVDFDAHVLRPGEIVEVPVHFTPRSAQAYNDVIPFDVNGLFPVHVSVKGDGLLPVLECSAVSGIGKLSEVAFGAVRVGQGVLRAVRLVNRTRKAVAVEVLDTPGGWPSRCVSFNQESFVIRPRDHAQIDLRFSPPVRVAPFKVPMQVRIAAGQTAGVTGTWSEPFTICQVSGACLGMEVSLETENINFGVVCEGARVTRTLAIYNTGDVPARFSWVAKQLEPHFAITPESGSIPAQSETVVNVVFKPQIVKSDIRLDAIPLVVEGLKQPLVLSVAGDCIAKPAAAGAPINFSCRVRESVTQNVPLPKNDTDKAWNLFPVISHEYWSGALSIEVPPKSSVSYPVTYRPLRMTGAAPHQEPQHDATVFVPLPDGSGVSFALIGKATPPAPAGQLSFKTPAKKVLSFSVPVENWLKTTQTLVVSWDPKSVPVHAQLRGAKTVDIPGLGTRDYKMSFNSMLEGKVPVALTFTNPTTQEYLVYDLVLETTSPGSSGTISLESVVRQCVSHHLTVENPLSAEGTAINFSIQCDHPCVRVVKTVDATGRPEGSFRIDFRPLLPTTATAAPAVAAVSAAAITSPAPSARTIPGGKPGKGDDKSKAADEKPVLAQLPQQVLSSPSARVILHSDQLGDFIYDLKLKATPSGPETGLVFSSALGTRQVLPFVFRHFEPRATTYKCVVTRPDVFVVPGTVAANPATSGDPWDGADCAVDVAFEGNSLGDVRAELSLVSEAGVSYTVPIHGSCSEPRPTGPYLIQPGGSVSVEFRNVFNEDKEFHVSTDNPALFVSTPAGVVKVPKKSAISISVKSNPGGSAGAEASGRLAVQLVGGSLPPWIYYLRSGADPTAAATKATSRSGSASKQAKPKGK